MLKTIIVLPDGTELSSGAGTVNAIQSVTLTECVNDAQELTLGSTCANMLEAKLIAPEGGLSICAGDELTVYKVDDNGIRHKVGLFTTEQPTRPSANTMTITAYDRVSWLDKDLGQWLFELDAWPYSLYIFAQMVCEACGLTLLNEDLPNGDYQIQAFSGEGITGRQLMQWVGQVAGRFCRATVDGEIEFAWYVPVENFQIGPQYRDIYNVTLEADGEGNISISGDGITVTDDGEGNIAIDSEYLSLADDGAGNIAIVAIPSGKQCYYYQNSLSYEDYQVSKIEKVQISLTKDDIGGVYPDTEESSNTYVISGNYLLTTQTAQPLEPVAQVIYEHLQDVTYTPCRVTIPATMEIHAGDIVTVTDKNGKTFSTYVMTKKQTGQKDTLECTGSFRRDSSTATNEVSYKALTGRVMELRADVEGLRAENRDTAGNLASLELDIAGVRTEVAKQETDVESIKQQISTVEQTATEIKISIQSLENDGVSKVKTQMGYTLDDEGLRIAKEGQEMENLLDNTGMYVHRSGEVVLQANNAGVVATDVTVRNYLVVGSHARFEDYTNGTDSARTACFWM